MASQVFVSAGISTIGVGKVSGTGDSVADGIGVSVSVARFVDEGIGVDVFVGIRVAVGGMGVDEAGTVVTLALSVVEGVAGGGGIVGLAT